MSISVPERTAKKATQTQKTLNNHKHQTTMREKVLKNWKQKLNLASSRRYCIQKTKLAAILHAATSWKKKLKEQKTCGNCPR